MSDTVYISYDEILVDKSRLEAILYKIDEDEIWIPRSLIESDDGSEVEIPEWFAIQEELL